MRSINLTDTPEGHTEDEGKEKEKESAADHTGNGYTVQTLGEIGCRARRARVGSLVAAAAVIHLHSSISVGRLHLQRGTIA